MKNKIKREILFERLSKENEIERQKANRDNRSKTKRKSESKKIRHLKESKKQTKHQKESKKSKKKQHQLILKSKISRNRRQNFAFFLTKKRKSTDIDTDIETLRRLTIIVTVLTKSYFSTDDIAEIIDELNKRKRRILTQVSEILTKLSKRWKILFFEKDFYFYDRENNDNNDLDFLFRRFNENLWKRRKKSRKKFVLNENFTTISETFSLFLIHDERKKK